MDSCEECKYYKPIYEECFQMKRVIGKPGISLHANRGFTKPSHMEWIKSEQRCAISNWCGLQDSGGIVQTKGECKKYTFKARK